MWVVAEASAVEGSPTEVLATGGRDDPPTEPIQFLLKELMGRLTMLENRSAQPLPRAAPQIP